MAPMARRRWPCATEQDRWRQRMEAQPTRFFFLELPGGIA